jgi:hypothetical protein
MFPLTRLLESADLTGVFALASIAGSMLSIVAMQMSWNEAMERGVDTPAMLNLRRASFILVSLTLLWSLSYAETKGWQPWPPAVAIVLALDFYLSVLIIMVGMKSGASSRSRWESPQVRNNGTYDH